ncbi:MAG: outer membrane beta-barrel protein [Pseudohongiellaceae bacterium]
MNNLIVRRFLPHTGTAAKMSLLALAIASSQFAAAAESSWYLGANVGQTEADLDSRGIIARQSAAGFTNTRLEKDDEDVGFKLFGGYQMSKYLAVEGGYFDLGKFGYKTFMSPAAVFDVDTKLRGVNIDLVGKFPMTEKLHGFGRFGATRYQSKDNNRGWGAIAISPFGDKDYDNSHKYGVGLQYDIDTNLSLRLEAERYNIDDVMLSSSDVDMYSLGLVYRFGRSAVAAEPVRAPVAAAQPRPVATPTPAPAPAPPPPAPVRVSFSADSLFGFDSATVMPAGKAELDQMTADLQGVDYDTIVVTGYTDRLGSRTYNLDLSNRRAIAVRDYLMSSANIPAAKISTRGANAADPVTSMAQCNNQLARAQLITCLAPDRRVEVEVTGSRPR